MGSVTEKLGRKWGPTQTVGTDTMNYGNRHAYVTKVWGDRTQPISLTAFVVFIITAVWMALQS